MHRFSSRFEPVENRRMPRFVLSLWSFAAIIGFVALSPSKVEATCGDYLSHHGMAHDQIALPGGEPTENVPFRSPCHGPSCQQGPLHHPLSTPVVSAEPQDRWGWMAVVTVSIPERISFLAHLCESLALPMFTFRLERPPKA